MIDGNGTDFTGFRVNTNIDITAKNVTVSQQRDHRGGRVGISLRNADGVDIHHNTIRGPSRDRICDNGIRDIYGDSDGIRIPGTTSTTARPV